MPKHKSKNAMTPKQKATIEKAGADTRLDYHIWRCETCDDQPEFTEFRTFKNHLVAIHQVDPKRHKVIQNQTMHLDGTKFYQTNYACHFVDLDVHYTELIRQQRTGENALMCWTLDKEQIMPKQVICEICGELREIGDPGHSSNGSCVKHLKKQLSKAISAYEMAENERRKLEVQIAPLANYIMGNVPGEPSRNESACECAVRIITQLQTQVAQVAALTAQLRDVKVLRANAEREYWTYYRQIEQFSNFMLAHYAPAYLPGESAINCAMRLLTELRR